MAAVPAPWNGTSGTPSALAAWVGDRAKYFSEHTAPPGRGVECHTRGCLLLTSAVIFTTVHGQDLEDMKGDSERGRRTPPLVYGEAWARWSLAFFVIFWSVACPMYWKLSSMAVWLPPLGIGSTAAVLTTTRRDRASDKVAWNLVCLWLSVLYILPAFSSTTVE